MRVEKIKSRNYKKDRTVLQPRYRARTRSVLDGIPTQSAHRYTQVLLEEYDDDRSYALRGNASQEAPRPLLNVAQMRAQAPALSTSCARLTESPVCAICDALRHISRSRFYTDRESAPYQQCQPRVQWRGRVDVEVIEQPLIAGPRMLDIA